MSQTKQTEDPSPNAFGAESRTACAVCGRDESGAWYWSDQLQRVICIDCHWRASTTPPPTPSVRKP